MSILRVIYRSLCLILCIFCLILGNIFLFCFCIQSIKKQKKRSVLIKYLSQFLFFIMRFKITATGLEHLKKNKNYLIVSNHMSYIDIVILSAFIHNHRFLSHFGVKKNPVLKLLLYLTNPYIINRSNFKNIRTELKHITNILKQGLHVVFFPEGTCSDASYIKEFYPPFFLSANLAQKCILPCYINYQKINKKSWSTQNRDLICWYHLDKNDRTSKKTNFFVHLFRFLKLQSAEAQVHFLPPINSKGIQSRTLAMQSREQICQYFTAVKES